MIEKFICIEGNLGAGKTTLANQLSKRLKATLLLESFLNNPFLEDLYANVASSKLPAELFFLAERIEQLSSLNNNSHPLVISDYHIEKAMVFAQVNLASDEKKLFDRIYQQTKTQLPIPNVIIFIEQNVSEAIQHINQRGRAIEANITPEYLQEIDAQYNHYLRGLDPSILLYKINAKDLRLEFEESVIKINRFLTMNHIV